MKANSAGGCWTRKDPACPNLFLHNNSGEIRKCQHTVSVLRVHLDPDAAFCAFSRQTVGDLEGFLPVRALGPVRYPRSRSEPSLEQFDQLDRSRFDQRPQNRLHLRLQVHDVRRHFLAAFAFARVCLNRQINRGRKLVNLFIYHLQPHGFQKKKGACTNYAHAHNPKWCIDDVARWGVAKLTDIWRNDFKRS